MYCSAGTGFDAWSPAGLLYDVLATDVSSSSICMPSVICADDVDAASASFDRACRGGLRRDKPNRCADRLLESLNLSMKLFRREGGGGEEVLFEMWSLRSA